MTTLKELAEQLENENFEPTPDEIADWRRIAATFPMINKAIAKQKRAGLDVESELQEMKDLQARIEKMLRVYD